MYLRPDFGQENVPNELPFFLIQAAIFVVGAATGLALVHCYHHKKKR
jgi:hypothetical protein